MAKKPAGQIGPTGHQDLADGQIMNKAVPVVEPAPENARQRFVAIARPEGAPPGPRCLPPS
ncbi:MULTISPECIES: hypothetical protein [unclassified Streptomyces]|uniref:hypothetical protein n=1 Tax=unclassified Streptomyces TaxID=2593676 RepID=UPI002252B9F3|nr:MULTISPECIES: hypothetical protein [unclassified Streptomyces]WSP55746.1 hypothetical protein OG306_16160 [Streptomyces sp. NBC_01241]WSU23518.1 hypothetical protein OG508_22930 [Streptomyces sp. NBC_01108]MCX4787452.1 hypothetical protein [Streptomyces sp. NBC_01221]MCX4796763.1 hypothetical protein [Streptomyces sp. NBC_01242]WSJ37988.1 hypothetical protein OG772_19560 [Streptomyces sp. NBC_01321]